MKIKKNSHTSINARIHMYMEVYDQREFRPFTKPPDILVIYNITVYRNTAYRIITFSTNRFSTGSSEIVEGGAVRPF